MGNGWGDFTDRWTSDLSWKDAPPNGKVRPLYILNFVLSGANQNEDSTWLAPRMTSVTWPSHVTWESSVFIILIHKWRRMTFLSRRCPYKVSVIAALFLACKQNWRHVRTCATAVKMADLKYYSLNPSFVKVSSFSFSLLYVEHDILPGIHDCWNWNRGSREVKNLYLDIDIVVLF